MTLNWWLLHCWSFGEVLKIRRPLLLSKPSEKITSTDTDQANNMCRKPNENTQVIPRNNDPQPVIPVNVADRDVKEQLMRCTVSVERLSEHTSTMVN